MILAGLDLTAIFEHASAFFRAGGLIMWPLCVVGFVLMLLLALQTLDLLASRVPEPSHTPGEGARLEVDALRLRFAWRRRQGLITTLVSLAPLLGLLGTVDGMITTFEGLSTMSFYAQGGGIAGGISQALTTTQMGLGIALPGLLVDRALRRWARRKEHALDQVLMQAEVAPA